MTTSEAILEATNAVEDLNEEVFCHRCQLHQLRDEGYGVSVISEQGQLIYHWLCERCCVELREDWQKWTK